MRRANSIISAISVCVLASFGATLSRATSIVLIRTPKHIVVAADSLIERGNALLPPDQLRHELVCKINNQGKIFFTSSGFDYSYPNYLARYAIAHSHSVSDAANNFSKMNDLLTQRMTNRKHPMSQQELDMFNGKSHLEYVFFGIEHSVPVMVDVKFKQIGNDRANLKLEPHQFPCPGACPSWEDSIPGCLGQCGAISANSFTALLGKRSDEEIVRELVTKEHVAVPQWVGGPIDVLTLDASGPHWEPSKGGTCSPDEIKPKPSKHVHKSQADEQRKRAIVAQ